MTADLSSFDHDPVQQTFMRQFISALLIILTLFCGAMVGTLLLFGDTAKGVLGVALGSCSLLLLVARARVLAGQLQQGVIVLISTLLLMNVIIPCIHPHYLASILPLLSVALALPYMRGRPLAWLIAGCWLLSVVIVWHERRMTRVIVPVPMWVDIGIVVVANSMLLGLILFVLWQFSSRVKTMLAAVQERESRFRTISELTSDYTYKIAIAPNGTNHVVWYSGAFTQLLGRTVEELNVRPGGFRSIVHPDDLELAEQRAARVLANQDDVTEVRIVHPSGEARWLRLYTRPEWCAREQRVTSALGAMQDITERKRQEQQIEQLAFYDALTGLANRRLLHNKLTAALHVAARTPTLLAVLYLDLNRFKAVNDTLGHDVGDTLLAQVAARLRTCVDPQDVLARLGGDEFAVLLCGADQERAIAVAQQINAQFDPDFVVDGHTLHIQQSSGIACFPRDGTTLSALLQHADIAMYHAKAQGHAYQVYHPALDTYRREQLQLESELRRAIQEDALTLYYQPIYDLHTQQVVRVEALVRWPHPQRGLLLPSLFIPLAEESGLIRVLDRWVLRAAITQAARWVATRSTFVVAINVSARSLQDHNLVTYISDSLKQAGVPARCIAIEITESAAMRDPVATTRVLHGLKLLGVGIALDDFGCGYTSLAYLTQLPVDVLKVDRTFVSGIGNDPKSEGVLTALLALGRKLGLTVVAEGVERVEQMDWLHRTRYDLAQGYLIGHPATPDDLSIEFLLNDNVPLKLQQRAS